ncbi:MAG: hypothetical protein U1F77_03050 [Kiritimatiellia bacterium]
MRVTYYVPRPRRADSPRADQDRPGRLQGGVLHDFVAGPVDEYPAAKAFADAFKAKFGKSPESYALYSYDAANVLVKAVEDAAARAGGKAPTREEVAGRRATCRSRALPAPSPSTARATGNSRIYHSAPQRSEIPRGGEKEDHRVP